MPTTTNHYTQALTKSSGSKCVGHWPLVGHRTNLILKWFSLFVPKNIYIIIVLFKKESSFNTHSINTINAVKPSGSIMQFHMIPWGCLELTYPPQVIGVHIRWVLFFLIVFETFVFWLARSVTLCVWTTIRTDLWWQKLILPSFTLSILHWLHGSRLKTVQFLFFLVKAEEPVHTTALAKSFSSAQSLPVFNSRSEVHSQTLCSLRVQQLELWEII